jgi:glutathione S-transferase
VSFQARDRHPDLKAFLSIGGQDHFAADILMVQVLRRLEGTDIVEPYPNLTAYIARGKSRPAYQRAFDAQLAVFTCRA